MQNLGFITNLGYSSYPPPYGEIPQPVPIPEHLDETPTKLADLGLANSPAAAAVIEPIPPAAESPNRVRLPKVKHKRPIAKPIPRRIPTKPAVTEPARYCPVCRWRFPAAYTDSELRRHVALSTANRCKEDIADYREAQRMARKRRQEQQQLNPYIEETSLTAQYGGVRLCPHCKINLEPGFTPLNKKTHIEACAQPRIRPTARRADSSDPFELGLSLLKKRRIVVEDSS